MGVIKLEPHCHTWPGSSCAGVTVDEALRAMKKHDYDAIVLTNHYTYYDDLIRPCDEIYEKLVDDYTRMKHLANDFGMHVFFGVEVRFYFSRNDYLIYGITPDELYDMGQIYAMTLEEFYTIKPNHVLIYQAHPFRSYLKRANPNHLDGVEVFNGHPQHQNNNDLALEWANKYNLLKISGSDFHDKGGAVHGGMLLKNLPQNERELVQELKKSETKCII